MSRKPPPRRPPPASARSPTVRHDAFDCFAIAAPGLAPLVGRELELLGIAPRVEAGGVSWRGDLESVLRANLWLRTASRVVVRVATFHARTFIELERHARRIGWERFVAPGVPLRFRVTSRKSRLYHTEAIAQRLAESVARRVGATGAVSVVGDEDAGEEPTRSAAGESSASGTGGVEPASTGQLFVVRVFRDELVVSADSSGELLHRRGYRQAVAKAPLRETLAAAMLLGAGWSGDTPLLDPLCGSGTIPIEAALLARRIAPGLERSFSALSWPEGDRARWERQLSAAREAMLERSPVDIRGSDRDAGAIASARANAERAGVAADVELAVAAVSSVAPAADRAGTLLVNPPYGVRIGESSALRDLYATLGRIARTRFGGWTLGVLSPGSRLDAQLGIPLTERFATTNGGISVRLMLGVVGRPEGARG